MNFYKFMKVPSNGLNCGSGKIDSRRWGFGTRVAFPKEKATIYLKDVIGFKEIL